jgi:signal transduction histidine kinase
MAPEPRDRLNVLVVDDEEHIRIAVERILRRLDCGVLQAPDGERALSILEEDEVAVVLLDLKMPGIDGMEVHRRILEAGYNVQVIIITGYATLETAIEAMKQGAFDFIPKPFDKDHLALVVDRALNNIRLEHERTRLEQDRQRALLDLNTEKSRIRTILESLPHAVIVTNTQGRVVLMNQTARHILAGEESPIGCEIGECLNDGELCELIRSQSGTAQQEGISYELDLGDGSFYMVRTNPVLGEEGECLGAVVVFGDISDLKRMDRLKSEFVAKVSHELRSPLSTIHEQMALVLQDMLEHEQPEKEQRILSRAKEKTRGMLSLIEDLLDLSRVEAGSAFNDVQRVDLREVIESQVDFLRDRAGEKGQELVLETTGEERPVVEADPRALESVIGNLVGNAVKYTPEEGRVSVRLGPVEQGRVRLEVEDTGIGIDEKEQARVFERFYRVKDKQTKNISGTGLGLPIVKGILDDMGGHISLRSQKGQGSTFIVTLPVLRS